MQQAKEQIELAKELMDEGVPFITALVMAGDIQSQQVANKLVEEGEKPESVVWMIGSYARFNWAVKNLPHDKLIEMLPDLWVSSDPDDTNPEYLELWREAWLKEGVIIDDKELPVQKYYTVYRGQKKGHNGISWSLDKAVAQKFAKTGGGRAEIPDGELLEKQVKRHQILAYLTSRGESEVIIDE